MSLEKVPLLQIQRDLCGMPQEGLAAALAGATGPTLDADDLEYSRAVIDPFLGSTDLGVILPCMFGDEAAREERHSCMGLTARAGFAVALADVLESRRDPVVEWNEAA